MKAKRILASVLSVALLLQLSPLNIWALDENPQQTPQVSTVQENIEPTPVAEPTPVESPAPVEKPAAEEPQEPTAAQAVQAMINALPGEVTNDNAEAVAQALTDIDDAKQSLTDEESARLDFARYDAAANALLALWGEAPTDAVELLDDNGTEHTPDSEGYYPIADADDLRWFADQVNNKKRRNINARLTANITMDGTEWTPIGTSQAHPFEGIFDGNGKTITGLTCTDTSKNYVGLVGYADGATIQNVTVKDSKFNGKEYIGAVCGFIVWGGITGCTTSGGTVSGYRYIGGIVGRAEKATIQRCVNTGKMTGINYIGGIVGSTAPATVQDCGNTGEVRTTGTSKYYAGIAGYVVGSQNYIHNCYNADSITAAKICDDDGHRPSNCYYLATNPGTDPAAKTAEQFASGEVAFLLQNGRTDAVWGQTLTEANKQNYPVLGGDKVYQTTPCTAGYSNQEGTHKDHADIDENGQCTACGTQCIAYTVTIPATVALGNEKTQTADITAQDITLPADKTLKVTVNGPFTATLDGATDVSVDYTIEKDGTALTNNAPVLTADSSEASKTTTLTFVKPDTAPYAGSYTGTVTFTVGVN